MKRMMVFACMALTAAYSADAQRRRRAPVVAIAPSPETFQYVDQRPAFNGNLSDWLIRNIDYPDVDQEEGNEGRVLVGFTISREGAVRNVVVKRSSGFATFDHEAMRVIRQMPPWKPGKRKGKPHACPMILPVTFRMR